MPEPANSSSLSLGQSLIKVLPLRPLQLERESPAEERQGPLQFRQLEQGAGKLCPRRPTLQGGN